MAMAEKPNLSGLRMAYETSEPMKGFLDFVATRQKNLSETSVERAERALSSLGQTVTRGNVVEIFKTLSELGIGEFIVGRRGAPTRFKWAVPMTDVGRAARGQLIELALEDRDSEAHEIHLINPAANVIQHSFNLRADFVASILLPSDLSDREASRLADYIKTLPFDPK